MKNRIIIIKSVILLVFFILIGLKYNEFKGYTYVYMGNLKSDKGDYKGAEELYLKGKETLGETAEIKRNIIWNKYREKNYKYIIENTKEENFLKGNSTVKESEVNEAQEKNKMLNDSLVFYKEQLKTVDDINVKKNYEIVKKIIEENKNQPKDKNKDKNEDKNKDKNKQNKQDQEKNKDQKNQDNQNQNNQNQGNQDDESGQNDKNNQQNNDKNKDENQKGNDKGNQNGGNNGQNDKQDDRQNGDQNKDQNGKPKDDGQGQEKNDNKNGDEKGNKDSQNNEKNDKLDNKQGNDKNKGQQGESKDDTQGEKKENKIEQLINKLIASGQEVKEEPKDDKNEVGAIPLENAEPKTKEEIGYILKRLEANEKQAFKNNERVNQDNQKKSGDEW